MNRCLTLLPAFFAAFATFGWYGPHVTAQLSELDLLRYAPNDTTIAIHIDVESVLGQVDRQATGFQYLSESARKEAGFDIDNLRRMLVSVGHDIELDEAGEVDSAPASALGPTMTALVLAFGEPLDLDLIAEDWFPNQEFEKDSTNGHLVYYAKSEWRGAPSFYAPQENVLVLTVQKRLQRVVRDEHPADSNGRNLVRQIDPTSDVHLIFDFSNLDDEQRTQFMRGFFGPLSGPGPLGGEKIKQYMDQTVKGDLQINFGQEESLLAKLEMAKPAQANELQQFIKTGLELAPGAIEFARSQLNDENRGPFSGGEAAKEMRQAISRLLDFTEDTLDDITHEVNGTELVLTVKREGGTIEALDHFLSFYAAQIKMMQEMFREMKDEPRID